HALHAPRLHGRTRGHEARLSVPRQRVHACRRDPQGTDAGAADPIPGRRRAGPLGDRHPRGWPMKRLPLLLSVAAFASPALEAQETDSTRRTVQEGIYARPVVGSLGRTSVGGYVEGNTNHVVEDGVGEGFSMELRRFNVFLFSSLGSRIRFISELEFEHGTEEIALETALIDVAINPSLVIRA